MDGEKEKTDKVDPSIPPKLDLKQAVAPQPPKKATTRIDMASAAMIPEEKSKTTRINLGSFGDAVPKTIKIQRPTEAATIKIHRTPPSPASSAATGPVTPLSPAPVAPPPSQAQSKRQTSRISLQEAFTAPAETPAAGAAPEVPQAPGPKTIRIKRPSDAGGGAMQETIHAPAAPAAAPAAAAPAAPAAPAPAPATEAGPITQRKTIKLRRPGAGPEGEAGPHAMTLPKAAADFAAAQAAGPDTGEDEPGTAFAIVSLVAVLVCVVLVYVLAVQAFPTLGLSWTGQVPTLR